jgi:hypothetical protein
MNTTVLTRAGWARQGEVMRFGAEMAVDHINAAGGIASSETLTPASSLATFRAGQEHIRRARTSKRFSGISRRFWQCSLRLAA